MTTRLNIEKLEEYLISIKEQLSRHEDELVHPVWWNSIIRQIDQITLLKRRLEHQGGDINALRELILESTKNGQHEQDPPVSGMSAKDSATFRAIEKHMGLLEADMETVKLIVRRVDVANATEALIMSQVRELQRYMRNLQTLIDVRAPSDAYGTLKNVVDTLETIIPQVDERLADSEASLKSYVDECIPVVSNEVALRVYQEERSKEIEFVPKKEYLTRVAGLKKLIEELDNRMEIADKNAVSRSFIQGKQTLQANIKRRLQVKQRDLFDRWMKFTEAAARQEKFNKLKDFHAFWPPFKAYAEKLATKTYFVRWRNRVEKLGIWDLYQHRLKKSILFWRDKACPDMKKALLRWKAVTVTSRIPVYQEEEEEEEEEEGKKEGEEDDGKAEEKKGSPAPAPYVQVVPFKRGLGANKSLSSLSKSSSFRRTKGKSKGLVKVGPGAAEGLAKQMQEEEEGGEEDPFTLEELAKVTVSDMKDVPVEHIDHKVGLLGKYVAVSSKQIDAQLDNLESLEAGLVKAEQNLARQKDELMRWIDSQCGAVNNSLQKWSNRATLGLRDAVNDHQELKKHAMDEIERLEEMIERVGKGLNEQKRVSKSILEDIDGIKLLQGDMLERTIGVEEQMASLQASYAESIRNAAQAFEKASKAERLAEESEKKLNEGLQFFDSEFKSVKKQVKTVTRLTEETKINLDGLQEEARGDTKKVMERMDALEDAAKEHYQRVALPDELAEICFSLEERAMLEPSLQVADLFRDGAYNQQLSNFCLRLAKQIHDSAHSRIMEKIIAGVGVKPSVSPSGKTTRGQGAKIGADMFGNEDTAVVAEQKVLLEAFSEEFVRLLRDRESRPGYVRAQTRVVLHSRFTAAIEMALGEMNSRDKKPYMSSVPSEFLNGMQVATSSWEGPLPEAQFPSPSKFETQLLTTFAPASTVNNDGFDDAPGKRGMGGSPGSTTGILGNRNFIHDNRSKTAPGVIGLGGEELSEIYLREESIPRQKMLQRPMSVAGPIGPDGSGEESPAPFQSRKLTASGKRDPFLAVTSNATGMTTGSPNQQGEKEQREVSRAMSFDDEM